ncbi:very-long-chain (3R)-3-hydroxyacyl-CoA dehydratase 2 [Biomphalaria glabrata]|uniref:Very-long-chain (3R)-3-hydroxyacyl-CoA dehydratase n=1 Tax=Biomphalaria glabrata TaxID=6526 RepID=A0A2C9M739_BIOGL|nr:very-long-chain (3R)-3-hydroxyacyl-CoA dehydratase 2-like [Biomphalaria glabrata]KAI8736798.1 very-long-chain (3R)-3-hydroxyacyl-CoA dehydratase 2-like [Biomphalaria glabrata]KAI8776810.1 very-long-chain (3R)-3-hydroxyacyl-CoA dehydratase 2 [Biomphalaria glabrata]
MSEVTDITVHRPAGPKPTKDTKQNGIVTAYLVAYNVSQMLGWTVMMIIMVSHIFKTHSYLLLYEDVERILQICQTAAILEIVHSMTGLVRSNWILTAFQVYSRVFLIWGIIWSVPSTQNGLPVALWLFAWTITEIIRYTFYFFSLLPGPVPSFLVWCRYTFFIILYPIGVTGELMSIFAAIPVVRDSKMYSFELPNKWNFAFNYYYYLCFIVISYVPVFPQLYIHMFNQRNKVLAGAFDRHRQKAE